MIKKFTGPLFLVLLGVLLVRLSWLKWANIMVDYGREVYVPWRITCGQVLYKDMASLFGPFPPYWNALLFNVFGASIMTLALFNILLVAGIAVLIYRFFSYTTDKWAALFASAAFLILFAFAQNNSSQGDFSYICPYSYSVTYAAFLSLCALEVFRLHSRSGRNILLAATGALIGLTALCRFEIFIFLALAITSGFIFKGIIECWPLKRSLRSGALILGGFGVPVGIAWLYFSTQVPFFQAWQDIFGFNGRWPEILKHNYYQMMTGLDQPWNNFIIMMTVAACYGLVAIVFKCLCAGAACLEKRGQRWKGAILVFIGFAGIARAAMWVFTPQYLQYISIFRGLPVVVILMVGYLAWSLACSKSDGKKISHILPLWVMSVWALLMLTKVFLNVKISSEGFVYAMPATMLFVVLFLGLVPKNFEGRRECFVRILTASLMVLIFIVGMEHTVDAYRIRNFHVGSGRDTVICKGDAVNGRKGKIEQVEAFLKETDRIMGRDANFVVFPQGGILNFLTKRPDPLPYNTFMFAEVARFGEEEMLRSFKEHRPDYVVITDEGVRPQDIVAEARYPSRIRAWILANYHPVWPLHPGFDNMIRVYKR